MQTLQLEHRRRIDHLLERCADSRLFRNQTYRGNNEIIYYFSPKYNFSYCKVPKVGSTFWTQVFTVLTNGSEAAQYIFKMTRRYISRNLISPSTVEFDSKEREKSRSILISRDPYSRLYSAFIDKMYLKGFSKEAVKVMKHQRNLPEDVITCANDVSFQEFLNEIVENVYKGEPINRHWAPITAICKPCNTNVLALLKHESFSSDVEYSLKELGIARDEYAAIDDALHDDHRLENTLPGMAEITLASDTKGCKTRLETARRIWKSFQIQGYLRDEISFPSDIIDTDEKASSELLIDMVMKTIQDHPLSSDGSRRQRRHHLVKAYENIDTKTIDELKKIYEQDFILFNYSYEPPAGP